MIPFLATAWFIVLYPSPPDNREIKLPTPYEKERWCQTEVIDEIKKWVDTNGGNIRTARAICRELPKE